MSSNHLLTSKVNISRKKLDYIHHLSNGKSFNFSHYLYVPVGTPRMLPEPDHDLERKKKFIQYFYRQRLGNDLK
jgi:hypothetical protein